MNGPSRDDDALAREVLRLNDRYIRELVIGCDVCPYAQKAYAEGDVERGVLLQDDAAVAPTLAYIDELESRGDAAPTICILIYPRLALAPTPFDHFVSDLRRADQERRKPRPGDPLTDGDKRDAATVKRAGKARYAAASFHPDYPCNPSSPGQLVVWFRRSPDPSIQLVRLDVLDQIRGGHHGKFVFDYSQKSWAELERRMRTPSVTDRITDDNHARWLAEGARMEAVAASIRADRDATYARLAADDISVGDHGK